MAESDMTAQEWKEKGNEEFKENNWSEASSHYTNALKLEEDDAKKAALYEYRMEAYLKLGYYEKVIEDCDSTLKICCNRVLHRRCQALEALKKFEEAYRDAQIIISSDPDNENIQSKAKQLFEIVQTHRKINSHFSAKVSQMLDLAMNVSIDMEKRETAMSSLQLLTYEKAGAEVIFKENNLSKIAQLAKVEKDEKIICSAIHIVDNLCQNNFSQSKSIMTNVLPWCLEMMNSTSFPTATKRIDLSENCLQNILNNYSGMNNEPDSGREALCEEYKKEIDTILSCLLNSVASKTIIGLARDAIIQLIMRNIYYIPLGWVKRLFKFDGLKKLMEVASQLEEHEFDITSSTQTIVSRCLTNVYVEMCGDNDTTFISVIDDFIEDKLCSPNIDSNSKIQVVVAITTLLLDLLVVADAIITKEKILKMILAMSETDDKLEQKVVCECIVLAITKYKKINVFIRESVTMLENLYFSMYDSIRIRAMVGLCELSKFEESGLHDVAIFNPFSYGMTTKLAKVCMRFLINPKEEKDIRKWAVKGLSYLTSCTEVKNELIKDQQAVKAMIELAKTDNQSVLYAVTTLVNLCNTYDDEEPTTEIKMFVKYYFSEEHLVTDNFLNTRRLVLVHIGVTSALVILAKTDSENIRELIARVFNAICILEEAREIVHQQGDMKALLSLAQNGTENGKMYASRALVHLAYTISPKIVFPGDIMMDVIWLIIDLLNPKCSVNETFEILTALRNLASVNDSMRKHIFKKIRYDKLMSYLYDYNHHMLRRTCAQLIHNLVLCRVIAIQCAEQLFYRSDNKFVLLCTDKDDDTIKAVAGSLVEMMSFSTEACKLIFGLDSSVKALHSLLTNPNDDIQCKGIMMVLNMMKSMKCVATKLMGIDIIMEQVRALSNNDTMQNKKIKKIASLALEAAAEWM